MPTSQSDRAENSRRNGRKSRGPKTPEGKVRSSQNSLKHGLHAQTLVLPYEDARAFEALHTGFHARFQPHDQVEASLVDRMAAATWRLTRAYGIETATLALALLDTEDEIEDRYRKLTSGDRIAFAFQHATETKNLGAIERAIARLNREFGSALAQFRILHPIEPPPIAPKEPEKAPVQNDPTPHCVCGGAGTPACRVGTPADTSSPSLLPPETLCNPSNPPPRH